MKQLLFIILITKLLISCSVPKAHQSSNLKNEKKHLNSPYVLLISIDGYRHDYNKIHKPKFLNHFARIGSSLESLRPSYPTKTFPNHLSIITGLYPMNHGIVANHFYHPTKKLRYSLKDRNSVTNADFYKGVPLWSLAEQDGMRTATYFWPGSEAKIANHFPTHYMTYNHGTPHEERINKVKSWLKLPKAKRPHFMTLYFHDVDSAGHRYGPSSEETKKAVVKVDKSIEKLYKFIQNLDYPVNIVITSDHGMHAVDKKKVINLTDYNNNLDDEFDYEGSGPLIHFYLKNKKENNIKRTLRSLNISPRTHQCYRNQETPKELHFKDYPAIGDIVCIARHGFYLVMGLSMTPKGAHGWSQFESKEMNGIFYAQGDCFKKGYQLQERENVNIYPLLAKILKLNITHKIDGDLKEMKDLISKKCL